MEPANPHDDSPTSLIAVLKDVTTSIVILLGALLITWIERLFDGPGPPTLVVAILKLSELTLFLFFLASFLTAMAKVLLKGREVVIIAQQIGMLSLLKMSRPSLGQSVSRL